MVSDEMLVVLLAAQVVCGGIGFRLGSQKQAGSSGLLLGLCFGPFGVIAAVLLNQRRLRSQGRGRQNGTLEKPIPICPHCGAEIPTIQPLARIIHRPPRATGLRVV
jgi:hypothetical protein